MAGSKQFTIFTKFAVKNNFSGPVLQMAKQADKMSAHLDRAKKVAAGVGKGMATAGKMLGGLAIGAAAAGTAVFKLAQSTASAADDILNTANAIGLSTQALQEYRYVGIQAGLTTEEMDSALVKLTKNLGNGSGEVENALYQIGVSAEELKAAGPDRALELIADGFKNVKNPQTKAAVAMTLFGKSSVRMVNALEKGSAGIAALRGEAQEIGYVMGEESLESAGNLDDAIDKLGATFTGVSNRLAAKAIPGITKFVDALQKGLQPGGALAKILDKVGKFGGNIGASVGPVFDRLMEFIPKIVDFVGDIWEALQPVLEPLLGMFEPILKIFENLMPLIKEFVGAAAAVLGPIMEGIKWVLDGIATITGKPIETEEVRTERAQTWKAMMASPMGIPMSPASSTMSTSSTSTSNVNISVGNLPPGSTVKQDKPAPGVTLNTAPTVAAKRLLK